MSEIKPANLSEISETLLIPLHYRAMESQCPDAMIKDEMAALLAGNNLHLTRIPARREMYQRYCSLPAYPAIIIGRFDPCQWAADPNRRSNFYDTCQKEAVADPATIKGFAGAAGCVEGIVRRMITWRLEIKFNREKYSSLPLQTSVGPRSFRASPQL